jgi:hypothetical protein
MKHLKRFEESKYSGDNILFEKQFSDNISSRKTQIQKIFKLYNIDMVEYNNDEIIGVSIDTEDEYRFILKANNNLTVIKNATKETSGEKIDNYQNVSIDDFTNLLRMYTK